MHDVPSTIDTPTAGISRRAVLKSGAAAGVVGLAGLPLLRVTETAVAASAPATGVAPGVAKRPGRLVLVFLRGAADHLSMTVPLDEANYQDARPGIAVDPNRALQLDDRFGFHPAMPRLHERYRAGQLAPLVAVGNPAGDRSHFVSQDLHERGSDGTDGAGNGWLARHLVATEPTLGGALRAITVGSNVDASLLGYGALGMTSLRSFGLAGTRDGGDVLADVLRRAHDGRSVLDATALQALEAATAVSELPASVSRDRSVAAFEDIATLLEADLGTDVITTSIDGWDTHSQMGDAESGDMRDLLGGLDDLVGGLADSLDDRGIDDVTTVVVTEFGRRLAENGSGGCDHGWGAAAFVLGAAANGGRVHGDWPGLNPDVVADTRGDVPMTTDYRDLLGDVVTHVLGGDPSIAFPEHVARPTGVLAST